MQFPLAPALIEPPAPVVDLTIPFPKGETVDGSLKHRSSNPRSMSSDGQFLKLKQHKDTDQLVSGSRVTPMQDGRPLTLSSCFIVFEGDEWKLVADVRGLHAMDHHEVVYVLKN
jgi:hypothetical protein